MERTPSRWRSAKARKAARGVAGSLAKRRNAPRENEDSRPNVELILKSGGLSTVGVGLFPAKDRRHLQFRRVKRLLHFPIHPPRTESVAHRPAQAQRAAGHSAQAQRASSPPRLRPGSGVVAGGNPTAAGDGVPGLGLGRGPKKGDGRPQVFRNGCTGRVVEIVSLVV